MGLFMTANSEPRTPKLLAIYAALVFAFLYLPIVVLIVYSFNGQGVGGFPPRDLTLNWYRMLFQDEAIWASVLNSLTVAGASVGIALALGIPAGLALPFRLCRNRLVCRFWVSPGWAFWLVAVGPNA